MAALLRRFDHLELADVELERRDQMFVRGLWKLPVTLAVPAIRRLGQYVSASYPPMLSAMFALCCAYGASGVFGTVDPHPGTWRPGPGTAVAAVTLIVTCC